LTAAASLSLTVAPPNTISATTTANASTTTPSPAAIVPITITTKKFPSCFCWATDNSTKESYAEIID